MNKNIQISASSKTVHLKHFWSKCVGAGRANEGLRANWQRHLQQVVKECGFQYLRFHGLFHDDMFVYRKDGDQEVYNWQYIDELFDALLENRIRPFIEFGFCPQDMASGETTQFWWKGNVTPPRDYTQWGNLIERSVTHWIERYGISEVRNWYFEVWNEPNLHAFWDGTKQEYFSLYKSTVKVIKNINQELRVGGPATSNFVPDERFAGEVEDESKQLTFQTEDLESLKWRGVWVENFLDFCSHENLPVDFISTHPYPTDFALDGYGRTKGLSRNVDSTKKDLTWLRHLINNSPFPKAEIHLTEWSSSPSPRDCSHDYLPAATFIVKSNIESSGLVDSLSYWTFTDVFEESGAGDSIFHGGFGMINFQGIVKPSFHAYRFLNYLGDREISRGDKYIATRNSSSGKLSLLIYHYPDEVKQAVPISPYPNRVPAEDLMATGSYQNLFIEIKDLEPGSRFMMETLDKDHGIAVKNWREMGSPEPPSVEMTRELKTMGLNTKKEIISTENSSVKISLSLSPWSLVSIREL
ncbi:MAG: hypothetical protein PQJ58_12250 [Spirochaetales bacterium]|nr:hypothetical protein [Spirochaetales bacterium]